MNVFATLIERPLPPVVATPPKDTRFRAADPRRIRKMDHLPVIPNPWRLTACQAEVLSLIASGLGNREVAEKLGVNIKTIEAHVQGLLGRMQAHSGEPVNRVRAAVLWDRFTNRQAA